jgi:hypothetical protein
MQNVEFFAGGMTLVITLVTTCVAVVLPLGITGAVFYFIYKSRQQTSQLVATGLPGHANIVQMGDTGMRINNQPRLSLVLDVQPMAAPGQPPGFQAFRTEHQCTVPMMAMARVSPGTTVPVKCDPQNPSKLTIDWGAMGYHV